jgi:dolichol-phosphate mannosyltransferase
LKIVFVVPALDERENLPKLAERLRAAIAACGLAASVVLVDDGSTDGTGDAARDLLSPLGVRVVTHPRNLGVAAAFRTGFAAALEECGDDDLVVTLEADNTSDIGVLPRLVDEARRGADLVLGSCYAPGGGVEGTNAWRLFLSGTANTLIKVWFGLWRLHTFSSFYRVHRAGALREVFEASDGDPLREGGFASVVELLARAHAMGFRVVEVPVVLRSHEREGRSKMRVGRTIAGYFRVMWTLGPYACRFRGRRRRRGAAPGGA